MALVTQRANAQAAPEIAHLKQIDAQQRQANQAFTANAINNIHAIGAAATARMNATEAANSAEQSSWDASQNANARNAQGFSNYLLDQTVVQNNSTGGHSMDWNSTLQMSNLRSGLRVCPLGDERHVHLPESIGYCLTT